MDQGEDANALDLDVRVALADRLSCDKNLRAEAWAAWRDDRFAHGSNVNEAEYWLDVEFVQPCPEDWPTED
ncbi:hypothetical protein M8445_17180 (plasmid) [Deinococcus aquaticus]|uniref:Uncharacterized protein n=1 Tax=Deinococcus aquaticus TaxID=328692 RepID=A0ABY7V6G2_9DEIO|nr:hypothetical protein [Deinococcus aquaticus]WDA60700.1 hypothetical protein M8445_17180 [Deinococcus aquaticus]